VFVIIDRLGRAPRPPMRSDRSLRPVFSARNAYFLEDSSNERGLPAQATFILGLFTA